MVECRLSWPPRQGRRDDAGPAIVYSIPIVEAPRLAYSFRLETPSAMKPLLMILGFLAAVLIIGQLVMGQMILKSGHLPAWTKSHQHSGYLTVVVTLAYIALSLMVIASMPKRERP
jgi:hypothetical protein